jgi:hypothetical protein
MATTHLNRTSLLFDRWCGNARNEQLPRCLLEQESRGPTACIPSDRASRYITREIEQRKRGAIAECDMLIAPPRDCGAFTDWFEP